MKVANFVQWGAGRHSSILLVVFLYFDAITPFYLRLIVARQDPFRSSSRRLFGIPDGIDWVLQQSVSNNDLAAACPRAFLGQRVYA